MDNIVNNMQPSQKRKTEVRLTNLLHKIRKKSNNEDKLKEVKQKKVHVKWKRYDFMKGSYSLVPHRNGGGFRYVAVDENINLECLKAMAIDLFFPNGTNYFEERATDCKICLTDSAGSVLNNRKTLVEYLSESGLYVSRTYFVLQTAQDIDEHIFDNIGITNSGMAVVLPGGIFNQPMASTTTQQNLQQIINPPQNLQQINVISQQGIQVPTGVSPESQNPEPIMDEPTQQQMVMFENAQSHTESQPANATLQPVAETQQTPQQINNPVLQAETEASQPPTEIDISNDGSAYADTVPVDPGEYQHLIDDEVIITDSSNIVIKVHRISMKTDMINAFKDLDISKTVDFQILDPRGRVEQGKGIGVKRDVYACTWKEILDSLFVGDRERIPYIRHDLYLKDWKAIGKILTKGYKDVGYFPIQISKAFLINCLFGTVSNDNLLDSFLLFLTHGDEIIVNEALKTTNQDIYDEEEFLDLLDRYNCRTRVHPLNVYAVMIELARQEIIQKPYLMICTFRDALLPLKAEPNFQCVNSINVFYKKVIPSNLSVIRLFVAHERNESERDAFKFLKQYVRGLNQSLLKKFLRFCTGADIILVHRINVSFIGFKSIFERRPIAHTCEPLLELPNSYHSFCELREEFEQILDRPNWEMDSY